MDDSRYVKLSRLWLRGNSEFNEKWVQDRIAEDPTILGLGNDVVLKDRERLQPRAGRLDLLMQDAETDRRYEVEIQLGSTDESHIIRTLEYWDIERKRYPQYDHCAVIVAEDITARFLNVISLLNGNIPLMAIQMSAYEINRQVALTFTTVMDELTLGLEGDDEEVQVPTDRAYWEERGSKETLKMVDDMAAIIHNFAPQFELKYNKFYIGLARDGQPNNFVIFRARKNTLCVEIRLSQSEEIRQKLETSDIEVIPYDKRWGRYRIRVDKEALATQRELLTDLLKLAHQNSEA